ncbi:MAG: hypothetical protein M1839_003601 [Geoglossum umbratile]|nr:MAG: hypothetical protein M1839_003601 [Geoglossum umbratile]
MEPAGNNFIPAAFRRAWRVIHTAPHVPRPERTPPPIVHEPLAPKFAPNHMEQGSCPLFTCIPGELRTRIFEFALAEYDDTAHPYEETAFYYRPGYYYRQRIDTALLRTCRLIYLEAHLIPIAINEHTFWCFRGPPHRRLESRPQTYFSGLTPEQRSAAEHIHFFTQQYWLEGTWAGSPWATVTQMPEIRPRKLTITIRHTDWWYWESDEPLGIDPRLPGRVRKREMLSSDPNTEVKDSGDRRAARLRLAWGNQFKNLSGLCELVIELETVERKRLELDGIVARAEGWRFELADGKVLVRDETETMSYTWAGSREFDGLVRANPRQPGGGLLPPGILQPVLHQAAIYPAAHAAPLPPPTNPPAWLAPPAVFATPPTGPPLPATSASNTLGSNANNTTITTPEVTADTQATATATTPTQPLAPVAAGLAMYVVVMKWYPRTMPDEGVSGYSPV